MSTPAPVHIYQTYIRASAEQVWQAITDPEFTKRYWHRTAFESAFEPGSPYRMVLPDGSDAVVGTIEVEPPRRLVMTWRILYDAAAVDEPPSRIEWLLTENGDGVTKVTTIHRDLGLSPVTEASVRDGWHWVLQSMKTLLETGESLPGAERADDDRRRATESVEGAEAEEHRRQGITANNSTWELARRPRTGPDEVDDVLGRACGDVSLAAGCSSPAGERRSRLVAGVPRPRRSRSRRSRPPSRRSVRGWSRRPAWRTSISPTPTRRWALACLGRLDEAPSSSRPPTP